MGSKALAVPQDRDAGLAGSEIPALSILGCSIPAPLSHFHLPCVSPPTKISSSPPQGITLRTVTGAEHRHLLEIVV